MQVLPEVDATAPEGKKPHCLTRPDIVAAELAHTVLVVGFAAEAVDAAPVRSIDMAAVVGLLEVGMKGDIVAAVMLAGHTVAEKRQYGALVVLEAPRTARSGRNSKRLPGLTIVVCGTAEHIAAFVLTEELVDIVDESAVHMTIVGGYKDQMELAESYNSFLVQRKHN